MINVTHEWICGFIKSIITTVDRRLDFVSISHICESRPFFTIAGYFSGFIVRTIELLSSHIERLEIGSRRKYIFLDKMYSF